MKLDKTDLKILEILQNNGRITNAELAQKIGISPPPALDRVRKLEKAGIIKKYAAIIDPQSVGIKMFAFVEVTLRIHGSRAVKDFLEAALKLEEVLECHHVTGDADFLLKIAVGNILIYEKLLLNKLLELPQIQHLKTLVVLSSPKIETAIAVNNNDESGSEKT
ncbi:hypothetical protein AMJ80_07025 [bacterium SM23_31]|nr:MAG: hypothetical protein AMJ80_07025 [bacterium SM23_31]